jgi:indolepyruvate ferredoxin oxidoreductase alpha subunit
MLGNEAIARGAIEAGIQVMAAYPGTPSSEIAETIINLARQFGIYAEWSINEKVAFEVALSASMCGLRGLAVMKHVGVNVAHDPLATAGYIGAKGGLVVVSADDPGQWSSQVEQDNRYIAKQVYIPVLEPSSSQEAKDMMADAFRLSEEFKQPFMFRSVTRISHARGDVRLGEISKDKRQPRFERNPSYVTLPANARRSRRQMIERMAVITQAVDLLPYNHLKLAKGAKLGIVASGIAYSYALEAVRWLEMEDKVSILKIGTPYPLPEKLARELVGSVPLVLVVEELEPIVETGVKAVAQAAGIAVKVHGKDLLPLAGELSTRIITEAIVKLTGAPSPVDFAKIDNLAKEVAPLLPVRPPTMCAGCPHRASHYAIKVAVQRIKRDTGVEPILPGDIGCYAMGASAPLNSDDVAICMGSGFDMAHGLAQVTKAPVIGHLGDSTFFHSGIQPMINAVQQKTKMTMVVMDNGATAMTGFQPRPGTGTISDGSAAPDIKIENIAKASGVKFVRVIDPFDLKSSADTLEKAMKFDGPSFVVARRLCSLLYQRDMRAKREPLVPYEVDQTKCIANSLPYCTATCPLHIDVRGYVGLVKDGKFDEALALIKEKLPFPAIVGRVCIRPCEGKCKRGEVDESIAINALKRSAADYGKAGDDLTIAVERQEKVAIVGGGPAGLMAAYDLRKAGYKVTIFEAMPVLGGMLTYGIPEYRLPKQMVRKELGLIGKLGVEVKLNTRVGKDIKLSDLKKAYNAVFIAVGAHQGRKLDVPNGEAKGVVDGIEFLRGVSLGKTIEVKDRVIIVGGGNVAIDCARTCLRLGFKDVNIMYRRSREEMPAIAEEVKEAENEGVKFQFLAVPTRVVTDGTRVTGAECTRMKLGRPDASGRKRPVPVKGSEFIMDTDMIISAIGEQPDLLFASGDGVSLAVRDGLLQADSVTLATNVPGVFAGGDVVSGPYIVIEALAAGRKAATSIDRYLRGEPMDAGREGEGSQESPLQVDTSGVSPQPRLSVPTLPTDQRCGNLKEVELGYSKDEATKEASRCLACSCHICIESLGCPAIFIDENKEVTIDSSQCPGCSICAQICPVEAIVPERSK